MIKIFGQTDNLFENNGDIVCSPLKAKVYKEDNGDFYLSLDAPLAYVDYLVEGNIIVAPTPQGKQAFRITNPIKTKSKITVKAWHLFFDTERYLVVDSDVQEKTCSQALTQLNNATEPASPFTVSSDNPMVASYTCVRKSLYEAIMDVVEIWGGHLELDDFSISIKSTIGDDNGITVQYKKNLQDITCEEDWDEVVTKLLPVGKDDVLLNAVDPDEDIYVMSSKQYTLPYVRTVTFNQDEFERDNYSSDRAYLTALVADLKKKANRYVNLYCYPKVNYSLKANIDHTVDIGDVVMVIDDRLGVNLTTTVISYEYDCITERYTNIQFGNFRKTLSNLLPTITKDVARGISELGITMSDSARSTNNYYAGDTADVSGIYCNGVLTTTVSFTVPLPKKANGLTATVTELKCNAFNPNGTYCFGNYVVGGYDVTNDPNITITATPQDNALTIVLTGTFTGTANTPINIELNSLKLEFGEEE